jgi:hypothetical protein
MLALLAAMLFAGEGAASTGAAASALCPTASQIHAELRRMGEGAALDGLGDSEVTVVGGIMRIVLRDGTGAALGVREVTAPSDCANRISVAAILLAAWTKTWNETALAPAVRPDIIAPRESHEVDLGVSVGQSADGNARALAGGVFAGVQLHGALRAAFAAGVAGERQVALGPGAATYVVSRLGAGPALHVQRGRVWTQLALLPQLTLLSLEGKNLATVHAATAWGASVEGRGRIGVRWGRLAPFISLALTRSFGGETLTLDDTSDRARLSPWEVRVEVGVSFVIGSQG